MAAPRQLMFLTYTGRRLDLLRPDPFDMDVEDVAHSLSLQCKWVGHVPWHYSVAQHSVHCAALGPEEEALDRLFHDAEEAYLLDLSTVVKHNTALGEAYEQLAGPIKAALAERFGLRRPEPPSVRAADLILGRAEREQLMGLGRGPLRPRAGELALPRWTPEQAETAFLRRYWETRRDGR